MQPYAHCAHQTGALPALHLWLQSRTVTFSAPLTFHKSIICSEVAVSK